MKRVIKGFIVFVVSLLLVSPVNTRAFSSITDTTFSTPSKQYQYRSYDYVIDNYDINILVNENNTLDITETITAYFNVAKHGIFRTIPLKNTVTRLDGTTTKNRVQITNLSVDNEYKVSKEQGNYKIQIGSENSTVIKEQTYKIKYTYNLGKDPLKDKDEFYYNLIGDEWDTVIGNITFTITMPKKFDASKLGFSSGKMGSTDNEAIKYNVTGNKIIGTYDGILNAGEALTIRCELEEGYFVNASLSVHVTDYIYFLFPILFLGVAFFLWYRFGRDDQVVETIEFYPPQGLNSLEVGFYYKGKADNQDVISLLIYLANKGYIKITEMEETSSLTKAKKFKITKLKDYDGDNINEKAFLEGLFSLNDDTFTKEVTSEDLYDNFYITIKKILSNINSKENKNKIFEKGTFSKSFVIILMIIATYFLITIPPILAYSDPYFLIFALTFPGIGFTLMFFLLFSSKKTIYVNGKETNSFLITKLFGLAWGCLYGGLPWAFIVLPSLLYDPLYLVGYFVGIGCIVGMVVCIIYLPKRTIYGNEILGKLRGFKNFLETAEKEKLEAMVMKDPTYFYNILPYTYVLRVSDKWIKKFETIFLQAPNWYESSNDFNIMAFKTFMSSAMISAQSVSASSYSEGSSSGGSSGGGFSGGGSGGGGGGSW